jgi:nitrogen fixation NifU-like protein
MVHDTDFTVLKQQIQREIDKLEEKTYSQKVIHEYRHPTNFGDIHHPNGKGEITGPCGDTMNISLRIVKGKVHAARFFTDGCGATVACGNMLTKMVQGQKVKEALHISADMLIKELDGLPNEHMHCAKLAINTLHDALANYRNK